MNLKLFFVLSFLFSLFILTSCDKDKDPPVIEITGSNPLYHCIVENNDYVDPGATAHDEQDGDLTDQINTVNNVDDQAAGTYTVVYTVEDKAGNSTTATRTVEVIYCK